jgi:DNA-binding MarR family transcriptional regulator
MTVLDQTILTRLYDRPSWSRSLQAVKPRVDKMIDAGLCERVRPPTGGARNMVAITQKGAAVIEAHWGKS